jgi:hypothetical protein
MVFLSSSSKFQVVGAAIEQQNASGIFTLPPLGEGARRADEGLTTSPNFCISSVLSPSSGLSATFPQWGKGDHLSKSDSSAFAGVMVRNEKLKVFL